MYIELTKRIHEQMSQHQFLVSVMGNLTQDFLKSIIRMTDNKLAALDINESIKKRIFHFMVECAQNICKLDETQQACDSLFLIGKKDDEYCVYLGSVFDNASATNIITEVNKVNALDFHDLKERLYEEMTKKDSIQNTLLLSLLDISKRTKEKIGYEEFPVDEATKFLSFKITLPNYKA